MARGWLGVSRDGTPLSADSLVLGTEEAVELGHAWVQALACRLDARILLIKGPTLHRQGLRPARLSGDIDLVVDPARFDDVRTELERSGWQVRPSDFASQRRTPHSVTYLHTRWPVDLDVHRHFPGFLAEPSTAFDALWERRESMVFAGRPCDVPDRLGGVLLLALHSLRGSSAQERHAAELEALLDVRLTHLERSNLAELAAATGCDGTLADVLPRLGVEPTPVSGDAVSPPLREWRERVAAGSHGSYFWLAMIRSASWRDRGLIVQRAIWPSHRDLLIARPETRDTALGRVAARVRRWGRGVRSLPRGVRAITAQRRG